LEDLPVAAGVPREVRGSFPVKRWGRSIADWRLAGSRGDRRKRWRYTRGCIPDVKRWQAFLASATVLEAHERVRTQREHQRERRDIIGHRRDRDNAERLGYRLLSANLTPKPMSARPAQRVATVRATGSDASARAAALPISTKPI